MLQRNTPRCAQLGPCWKLAAPASSPSSPFYPFCASFHPLSTDAHPFVSALDRPAAETKSCAMLLRQMPKSGRINSETLQYSYRCSPSGVLCNAKAQESDPAKAHKISTKWSQWAAELQKRTISEQSFTKAGSSPSAGASVSAPVFSATAAGSAAGLSFSAAPGQQVLSLFVPGNKKQEMVQ
eukprot:4598363-Amphidinium_carterae.1